MTIDDGRFDEAAYLAAHPDVAAAVRAGGFPSGRDHYEKFGAREGRTYRPLARMSREDKVFRLLDKKGRGLEIGPSHNPIAPKARGFDVDVLDHLDTDALREKYAPHGVDLSKIEPVDFVWRGEALPDLIGKTAHYDWIIASHVIEHVPDMVSFLRQCAAILKPDGVLSLIVPDRRYCFDVFTASSTTGGILDAYTEKRVRPSHGQVMDYFLNAVKRRGALTWTAADGRDGGFDLMHSFVGSQAQWQRSIETTDYIDIHCWRFTPASFRLILGDLRQLGLIDLGIGVEFPTDGCEFYVSLRKAPSPSGDPDRLALLQGVLAEQG